MPASFVAPVWGISFCDCGESGTCCRESVYARKSDNPYDYDYSSGVIAVAVAGCVSEKTVCWLKYGRLKSASTRVFAFVCNV